MPSPSATLAQAVGALASHVAQCSSTTTVHPASGASLAWDTLRTNLKANCHTAQTRTEQKAMEDFLDTCPTLRYRGTP